MSGEIFHLPTLVSYSPQYDHGRTSVGIGIHHRGLYLYLVHFVCHLFSAGDLTARTHLDPMAVAHEGHLGGGGGGLIPPVCN